MEAIERDFGSFQALKEKMSATTVAVQGSGWGWLGYEKESGRLRVAACANQDPLQGTTGRWSFRSVMSSPRATRKVFAEPPGDRFLPLTLRSHPASRNRRLGARLLSPVQERAAGLREGDLERRQLGERERTSAVCQKVKPRPGSDPRCK